MLRHPPRACVRALAGRRIGRCAGDRRMSRRPPTRAAPAGARRKRSPRRTPPRRPPRAKVVSNPEGKVVVLPIRDDDDHWITSQVERLLRAHGVDVATDVRGVDTPSSSASSPPSSASPPSSTAPSRRQEGDAISKVTVQVRSGYTGRRLTPGHVPRDQAPPARRDGRQAVAEGRARDRARLRRRRKPRKRDRDSDDDCPGPGPARTCPIPPPPPKPKRAPPASVAHGGRGTDRCAFSEPTISGRDIMVSHDGPQPRPRGPRRGSSPGAL